MVLAKLRNLIVNYVDASASAIKAKTDLLPVSPAQEGTLTAIKTKTDLLPSSPGTQGTANGIKSLTDTLPSNPGRGIRRIYRDSFTTSAQGNQTFTLGVTLTDPNKCWIEILGWSLPQGVSISEHVRARPYLVNLTTTQITLSQSYGSGVLFTVQIVEWY